MSQMPVLTPRSDTPSVRRYISCLVFNSENVVVILLTSFFFANVGRKDWILLLIFTARVVLV
jgi:hypothetical protein